MNLINRSRSLRSRHLIIHSFSIRLW